MILGSIHPANCRRLIITTACMLVLVAFYQFSDRRHVYFAHFYEEPSNHLEPPVLSESSVQSKISAHSEPSVHSGPSQPAVSGASGAGSSTNVSPIKPAVDSVVEAADTSPSASIYCAGLPSLDNLVVVVKTGATEIYDKLPTLLLTYLQCSQNFMVFSDMEQEVAGHHVYDALEDIVEEVTRDNPDFNLYQTQKEWYSAGEEVKGLARERAQDAWKLDKYKNIHTAKKAWDRYPNKDWYFFIDADTYIVWPTVAKWLKRLDSARELYLGSVAYLGDCPFAHGGSGYVISGVAMAKFAAGTGSRKDLRAYYDQRAKDICCGDVVMAQSLFREKIQLWNFFPMINGEKPKTLPFGPAHWCQPLLTMHHIGHQEITDMWKFELERAKPDVPILIKDVFEQFLLPNLTETRDNWDNFSEDTIYQHPEVQPVGSQKAWEDQSDLEKEAYKSFDDCGRACKGDTTCFQWSFIDSKCALSKSFKRGKGTIAHVGEERHEIRSGWDLKKIEKFRQGAECPGPAWINVDQAPVYSWEDKDGI